MKFLYLCILCFLVFSCDSTRTINDSTFRYRSKKRNLRLIFGSDSTGKLVNVFRCRQIDDEVRSITFSFIYKRSVDTIFIRNTKCEKEDSCLYDPFFEVPPQSDCRCSFLSKENRFRSFFVGPRYMTDFEKYGLIPNIDIDTLYFLKGRKLFLMKNSSNGFYIHYLFKAR